MINSSQSVSNTSVRSVEPTMAKAVGGSAPVTPPQDTAEISSFSQSIDGYMKALQSLPASRPDVVTESQGLTESVKNFYPPLDIIAGIGKLVGGGIEAQLQRDAEK